METDVWLLFMHHLPPRPPYLRAKVGRRLAQLGAIAIKNSAYVLPDTEGTLEDFQWLRREIEEDGGRAWVVRGELVGGLQPADAREAFRAARAADYTALSDALRSTLERARATHGDGNGFSAELRRLEKRFDAVRKIDFFDAPGRDEVEVLMNALDRTVNPRVSETIERAATDQLKGRTWLTRPGVKIDRIASAWLIRRFIDPAATFAFAGEGKAPADPLRFDMFEGEFTHEGQMCTFEVLLRAAGLEHDQALVAIGQIVHDLDIKDEAFQRPETAGVHAMVAGVIARTTNDAQRLAEGAALFDLLHASLAGAGKP